MKTPINNSESFLADVQRLQRELKKLIVGMDETIWATFVCLFAGGHLSYQGVPGGGKSTLSRALGASIQGASSRFQQFRSDLFPAELVGGKIFDQETKKHIFQPGVINPWVNFVIADEINRAPDKTVAAMLEVMEERQISVPGEDKPRKLADPFLLIATQNPLEGEDGVFPLPKATKDRFAMQIKPATLSFEEEMELISRPAVMARDPVEAAGIKPVLSVERLREMITFAQRLPMSPSVKAYAITLVRSTRPECDEFQAIPEECRDVIAQGAGQRGNLWITACAKSVAALRGADCVTFDDVKAIARTVLVHRINLKPGVAFGKGPDFALEVIDKLVSSVQPVSLPAGAYAEARVTNPVNPVSSPVGHSQLTGRKLADWFRWLRL